MNSTNLQQRTSPLLPNTLLKMNKTCRFCGQKKTTQKHPENLQDRVERPASLSVTHALVSGAGISLRPQRIVLLRRCSANSISCARYGEDLSHFRRGLETEPLCKGLPDKGNGACQRFSVNLRPQTVKRGSAPGKAGVPAHPRNQEEN